MSVLLPHIMAKYNYWAAIVLMLIGLYGMISKNNLLKKVVGMSIFQTAIILFYVSMGVKRGGAIPILLHQPGGELTPQAIDVAHYVNPLPHVLMLTAIVVGVSTLGVALAILQKIQRVYGTIEEDEILARIKE